MHNAKINKENIGSAEVSCERSNIDMKKPLILLNRFPSRIL